ncbi:MAG: hypothetical protein LC808_25780 [Actinobacteria bacterium]|nr:hypothetical protein [Actinomycetota bacterium]
MPTVDEIRHGSTGRPVAVTSTVDGRDHLISEHATAVGLAAGHGQCSALCGHRVVAAPLVVPPGPTCLDCETALHRVTTGSAVHRRSGVVWRFLRRRRSRSASRSSSAGSHRVRRV